ncbi:acyltransferase family protein [Aquihabitans sp. McL0605]|uniref:acyltransferase family protein n=1 Tax=Aquihabitans sp. McL0605 TaxID=3415671 RepID=UPI003CEB4917
MSPAPPAASPPKPGYIPGLDGLRAVAVFAVVAYHLEILGGGFLGVDVFFVISGFLITRLLLAERERRGGIALGSFWIRRFKRLLPALLVVLVAVAIGARLWLPAWRLGAIRGDALAALAYVANWRFILSGQSYFASGIVPTPLRHTWSLAIEEQFYLVWPLVVVGLGKVTTHLRRSVAVVAGVAALASAGWMAVSSSLGMDLSRIYYGTDTRVFALFGGALLGCWWDPASRRGETHGARRRWAQRWAVVGALALVPVVAFFFLGSNAHAGFYQWGFQLLAVLSVLVVAGVATGRGPQAAVLANPVLVWLGRRSYGIYLWSWPAQVFLAEHFGVSGLALDASVVVVAVSFATLSFWLVEEPIRTGTLPAGLGGLARRRGHRPDRTPRVPRAAWSAMAFLLVIGVVVGTSAGAPPAPTYASVSDKAVLDAAVGDISAAEEAKLLRTTSTTEPIDEGPPGPFTGARSLVVSPTASVDPSARLGRPLKVLLTGDSVGWSLGWELGPTLSPTVSVDNRAIIGCGLMPYRAQFIVGGHSGEDYPPACQKVDVAELKGLADKPDAVLLWVGAWEVYDQQLDGTRYQVGTKAFAHLVEQRIQERVDRYRSVGVPTVMPVVPCFGTTVTRLGKERLQPKRIDWVNERVRKVAQRNKGWVRLIDPGPQLCDASGKAFVKTPTGLPLREDGAHFQHDTAVWFWNSWLAGQMGAAFDVAPPPPPTTSTTPTTSGVPATGDASGP